ncbi:MAG TPA: TolC family protein [Candidatus Eisenbacteria bacterium]|nr:TolC family protein [Candidatus Eisenbacteria bacterium]
MRPHRPCTDSRADHRANAAQGDFARILAASLPVLLALGIGFGPDPARAEPWTLDRVVAAVMEKDPGIQAARSRGEAGRAAAGSTLSSLSPRLAVDGGFTRTDDPALLFSQKLQQGRFTTDDFALPSLNDPPPSGAWNGGLVVEQPIWNSGLGRSTPSLSGSLRSAADASERAGVADRVLEAVGIFVAAVRARSALRADSISLAAATEHRRAAVERFRMGQVPELDTLRASARMAEARTSWLSAETRAAVSRQRLSQLVGASVEELGALPAAPPAGVSRADSAEAMSLRGEVVAAREITHAREIEATRASLARLPSVNARFDYRLYRDADSGAGDERYLVGVTASLPIWDLKGLDQARHEATARADEARAREEILRREIALSVAESAAEVSISRERSLAARLAHESSEEALRLAQARYGSGLLSQSDLLAVDAEAARHRLARVDAEASEVMAHYRDLHARGQLP